MRRDAPTLTRPTPTPLNHPQPPTSDGGSCYVKNDSPYAFAGKLEVSAVDFATGKATALKSMELDMPAGAGVTQVKVCA